MGEDKLNAELFESATDLSGFRQALELFFQGQILFIGDEDSVFVGISSDRKSMRAGHASEDNEVACGVFLVAEGGGDDVGGGIVDDSEEAEPWPTGFKPIMGTAVGENHQTWLRHPFPAFTMFGRAMFARRGDAILAQDESKRFVVDLNFFVLRDFFMHVGIVESGILGGGQTDDFPADRFRRSPLGRPATQGVGQYGRAQVFQTSHESPYMAKRQFQKIRGASAGQPSIQDLLQGLKPSQFFGAHGNQSL